MEQNVFEREETVLAWDKDYYHPIAERYYDRAIPDMLRAMGAQPGDHVLDAGCGPGVHAIRAAKYGCQVTAIDLSERMLTHARDRSSTAGVSQRIEFKQDDLTDLSLESSQYPFVFSWGVIIHVPETEKAIDHLCRITQPGGKLALQISNVHSLDFKIERLARRILSKPLADLQDTPLGQGFWYDFNDDRLWVLRFDAARLTDAMAQRGFQLVCRRAAEFTEMQWRIGGPARAALLWGNRLAYALRAPAGLSCTQIMIFEKTST